MKMCISFALIFGGFAVSLLFSEVALPILHILIPLLENGSAIALSREIVDWI
jgi:hypothetical protein